MSHLLLKLLLLGHVLPLGELALLDHMLLLGELALLLGQLLLARKPLLSDDLLLACQLLLPCKLLLGRELLLDHGLLPQAGVMHKRGGGAWGDGLCLYYRGVDGGGGRRRGNNSVQGLCSDSGGHDGSGRVDGGHGVSLDPGGIDSLLLLGLHPLSLHLLGLHLLGLHLWGLHLLSLHLLSLHLERGGGAGLGMREQDDGGVEYGVGLWDRLGEGGGRVGQGAGGGVEVEKGVVGIGSDGLDVGSKLMVDTVQKVG